MDMDKAKIKAELLDDVASLGYKPLRQAGDVRQLTEFLNTPRNAPAFLVSRGSVTREELGLRLFTEFVEMQLVADPLVRAKFAATLRALEFVGSIPVDSPVLTGFLTSLQAAGVLRDRPEPDGPVARQIERLTKRPGSRAEVLWGIDARVTAEDVGEALNS